MARITQDEANAWAEKTKLEPTLIFNVKNLALLEQLEEEILARITPAYDPTLWVDATTTPRLVRVAIAKTYVAWAYRRAYSEDISDADAMYAALLQANAETIIQGLIDGVIEIPGEPTTNAGSPVFYPTDDSSAACPTDDDPSLGPAKFSMSQVF
jgi:hypothetical protein